MNKKMKPEDKYILYLSQVVDISVRILTTDVEKRRELENKLLDLFYASLFVSLKDKLTQQDIEEITKKLKPNDGFDKNLVLLLASLSEKVGEEKLFEVLLDDYEKFASKVVDMTHKTIGPEASKAYDNGLAKLGQGFIDA